MYDIIYIERQTKILPLQIAILPLIFLVTLLSFNLYANVFIYDADPLAGSSQFILILSGAFAALIGHRYNVSYKDVLVAYQIVLNRHTSTNYIIMGRSSSWYMDD